MMWVHILVCLNMHLDVQDTSGEGGCLESSKMESWSWKDCC